MTMELSEKIRLMLKKLGWSEEVISHYLVTGEIEEEKQNNITTVENLRIGI